MTRGLRFLAAAWLFCFATAPLLAQDTIPPAIFCPGDMNIQLAPGECAAQVFFNVFATDNQPNPSISQIDGTGLSYGDDFPIGSTTLIFEATDGAGNKDTCDFTITVFEYQPPTPGLVCDDLLYVSMPANCIMSLTPGMVLEGNYGCFDDFIVNVDGTGSGTLVSSMVGETLPYIVTNTETGMWCWGEIFVEDKVGPFIENCDSVFINCLQDPRPVTQGGDVPVPTFTDCFPFTTVFMDMATQGTCNDEFSQIIMRIWTATDSLGNVSTCNQIIVIERVSLLDLTVDCPADWTVECVPGVTPNFSPAVTGYPFDTLGGVVFEITENLLSQCNITSKYADMTLPGCGASYRIMRTWTIFDWCLPVDGINNPRTCIQILHFKDTTPPVISVASSLTVSANLPGCRARPVLPPAVVTDCSSYTVTITTPVGVIVGNGGQVPAPGLTVGTHVVTYKVVDACGNSSSQNRTITVVDNVKPTPVCDSETTVSLDNNGYAFAYATTFDDGSTDNCCIEDFQVARMTDNCGITGNLTFDGYVEFCCADVGTDVPVILRVFDCHGNFNECMVLVEVQDKLPPTITCPPNITLNCGQDYNDLNLTGEVVTDPAQQGANDGIALDNCAAVTVSKSDVGSVYCGSGVIYRTWKATGVGGLMSQCTQTITVVNNSPAIVASSIIFPPDVVVFGCDAATDPDSTGSPILPPASSCHVLVVGHTDQIFTSVPDACRKILRTWTVLDWCIYNPNVPNSPGRYDKVQVIKVIDTQAPTFPAPVNKTFCNFKPDCGWIAPDLSVAAHDDCVADQQITYSWTVDLYDDGVADVGAAYAGQGQNTTNSYPNGTHEITYAAYDGCGNTGFTSFKFTIEDCKKPTVYCKAGLIVEMMQGGQVSVNVLQLEEGTSFDNCTARPNLEFSFSPNVNDTIRTYDCSLLGANEVEIWATDEENNQDYCTTVVIIQDNMNACSGNGNLVVLNGNIANEENEGVEDVSVELNGNSSASTLTASQGTYQFTGIAAGYDYTVTPHLDQNPLNGVSTFDLVLLNRHILGIISLDSPYKIIAADVNRNGVISISDVIDLRKVILHITPTFTNNTSWRFVDKAHVFPNPANPFSPAFPEVCNVNDLATGSPNTDFVAVKIGDLNGNAAPGSFSGENEDRTGGNEFVLRTADRQVKAGELVTTEFLANPAGMLACQFTLNFDRQALHFEKLTPGENASEQNFGLSLLEEGAVTASWNQLAASATSPASGGVGGDEGEVLFTLIFKAKQNGKLSDWLDVNSRFTKAESYDRQGNEGSVSLKFDGGTGNANRFELFQNVPNPFGEATVIGFQLPENSPASLTIFDLSGRVVKEIKGEFLKGYHEISIGKSDLPGAGVFYYRLETPQHTASKKLVVW